MLNGALKAVIVLNNEPDSDSSERAGSAKLGMAEMVVTLSPFKANMEFSDVLLPIAPFTETPGTFVNAEGRVQSFHAVVKPLAETRPAWKVLRVLANMLKLPGFEFESTQQVLDHIFKGEGGTPSHVSAASLSNAAPMPSMIVSSSDQPVVATIYQLDSIVRRATSLQLTSDALSGTRFAESKAVLT